MCKFVIDMLALPSTYFALMMDFGTNQKC